jgi:hypothetical protein
LIIFQREDYKNPIRSPEEVFGNGTIFILARGIPELNNDILPFDLLDFALVVSANGAGIILFEASVYDSKQDAGLPHSAVSY